MQGRDSTSSETRSASPRDAVVITLNSTGHQWRLACAQGEEHLLVDALIDLVERDDAPLEWSDAAAVIRRLNDQPSAQPASPPATKSNPIEPHA